MAVHLDNLRVYYLRLLLLWHDTEHFTDPFLFVDIILLQ